MGCAEGGCNHLGLATFTLVRSAVLRVARCGKASGFGEVREARAGFPRNGLESRVFPGAVSGIYPDRCGAAVWWLSALSSLM